MASAVELIIKKEMSASKPNMRGMRRRRPGGLTRNTSSSRRLSSVVNPDLLHDVVFHAADEHTRANDVTGLTRRHSIAGVLKFSRLELPGPPQSVGGPRTRAVSERVGISQQDAAALLTDWKESERKEGRPQKLKTWLSDLPEESLEEESDEDRALLQGDQFADGELIYDEMEAIAQSTPSNWSVNVLVGALFLGYISASAALQQLNSLRPGCAQLVTLCQYLSVIVEKGGMALSYVQSPIVPIKYHALFVVTNYASVAAANKSLALGLPFSLFLVIKNTNLLWSLMLGMIVFGRSFTSVQIMSIATITCGIIICVLGQNAGTTSNGAIETVETKDGAAIVEETSESFLFGAALAAFSTFAMALLGSVQEALFATYHEADGECLFFTHSLGLPLFCLGDGLGSIRADVMVLSQTPALTLFLLVLNILATLAVKHSFVHLLEEGEGITATLACALARMTGVLLSQLMASDSASHEFWVGMLLVGGGGLSYATGGRIFKMCGLNRYM